jgi:hypothetical protein
MAGCTEQAIRESLNEYLTCEIIVRPQDFSDVEAGEELHLSGDDLFSVICQFLALDYIEPTIVSNGSVQKTNYQGYVLPKTDSQGYKLTKFGVRTLALKQAHRKPDSNQTKSNK